MAYFNQSFIEFFKKLSKNNNTEWFNENRKAYEQDVKKPFTAFVEEMIGRVRKHEPQIEIKPGDAIMRINKDIRFSKDKIPYNTHMAANISAYGKKDKTFPGFYFQFSADKIVVIGGSYMIEPDKLKKIRTYISAHLKEFTAAYKDKKFSEKFGEIKGEKSKRLEEPFQSLAAKEPLIANKQFYYQAELKPSMLTSDKLPDILMEYYMAGRKVNAFLREALRT